MKMHIVIGRKSKPASGERVVSLCGETVLVDRPAEGTVTWSDGRVCSECLAARANNKEYAIAKKVFVVIEEHDVRGDYCGAMTNRARLTCYTRKCNGATLVHQPYMTPEIWDQKRGEFLSVHECREVRDLQGVPLSWAHPKCDKCGVEIHALDKIPPGKNQLVKGPCMACLNRPPDNKRW